MTRTKWLGLGMVGCVLVACGGSVTLGNAGGDAGSSGSSGASSSSGTSGNTSGSSSGSLDCSAPNACGPTPVGGPAEPCGDGTYAGLTGKCIAKGDGTCGWESRQCPTDAGATCLDDKKEIEAQFRQCKTNDDCVATQYNIDCCGSQRASGIAKAHQAEVEACLYPVNHPSAQCDCLAKPTVGDDGSNETSSGSKITYCNPNGICETSFVGTKCGTNVCGPKQQCCDGVPFPEPTCFNGVACPISQRKFKKDIAYLSESEKKQLSEELMSIPIATYRYKAEGEADRPHLGFIIDDIAPSPAVAASGERVDLYGYTTMSVAAVQMQAKEIAELKREVEALKRQVNASKR